MMKFFRGRKIPEEPPNWVKWLGPLGGSVWLAFRIIRDLFF
jgi:hypothetical protein